MMLSNEFEGTTLESSPLTMTSDEAVQPFISGVSPDGIIELGFSEPMATTSEQLADPLQSAIRKLSHDVYMRSTNPIVDSGFYEVFDAIEIQLISSQSDLVAPKSIDWSLKDFDG